MKNFKCNFGKGVTCEIRVSDTPPANGGGHIQQCIWSGQPTKKTMRPYIDWINSVNKQLSDEWGIKILHVFQLSPRKSEAWRYEPGAQPKKVAL